MLQDKKEIKHLKKLNYSEFPEEPKIKFESIMIEKYKNRTKDDRKLVDGPISSPFKPIGALLSKGKDRNFYLGTGVLIAPNFVLTAAHNPYEQGFRASEFYFAPAINSKGDKPENFTYSRGTEFFIFEKYAKTENTPDLAIMKLEKPLGEEFGYFDLKSLSNNTEKNYKSKRLNFYGYPGDKFKEANNTYQMWGQHLEDFDVEYFNNEEKDESEKNLVFKCDSYSGMSGAPIFEILEEKSGKAAVYAVFWGHEYTDYENKKGYAYMLNEGLIEQIKEYIKKNE